MVVDLGEDEGGELPLGEGLILVEGLAGEACQLEPSLLTGDNTYS